VIIRPSVKIIKNSGIKRKIIFSIKNKNYNFITATIKIIGKIYNYTIYIQKHKLLLVYL